MEKMLALGIILSAKDMLTPSLGKAGEAINKYEGKIKKLGSSMTKLGTVTLGAGMAIGAALKQPYEAFSDLKAAQGEIKSLDIGDLGISKITDAAVKFSNTFSGTTAPDFVRASYDIKSGIASLSDTGVAEFTRLASLTGKATKSTTEQMTSFFATGYGIYTKQFDELQSQTAAGWNKLSQEEKDIKFGQAFSAGIGAAVKQFKTTGSEMQSAIETLGAAATTSNVPLSNQLAILGTLNGIMSGSEGATKYKAFLKGAAKAQEDLNMSFVDQNNQLLSTPQILEKLHAHYGNVLDDMEKMEITKAFGSDEAAGYITALYDKTGQLKDGINSVSNSMANGTDEVERMAKAMNDGHEMELLQQRIGNLITVIGTGFAPIVNNIGKVIGKVTMKLGGMIKEYPELTRWVTGGIALFGATAVVLGTVAISIGALTMAIPMLSKGFLVLGGAIKFVGAALGFVGKILLLNPIGLAVTAIAAAAYLIYTNWDKLKVWFSSLWTSINDIFSKSSSYINEVIQSPIASIKAGWETLLNWFSVKFEWLADKFNTVSGWVGSTIDWLGLGGGDGKQQSSGAASKGGKTSKVGAAVAAQPSKPLFKTEPLFKEKSAYTPEQQKSKKSGAGSNHNYNVNLTVNNPAKGVNVEKAVQKAIRMCNSRSLSDDV
ncbi:MAG TPA: phage tail tape measure protein [Sulfurovum sp. UBA12169]|nr:MAG TPA: phage tail tape measure protein [Sulfurovum sp. UBA12169]